MTRKWNISGVRDIDDGNDCENNEMAHVQKIGRTSIERVAKD